MNTRKSWFPFLLINVVLSAVTTLLVLFLWDRLQPTAQITLPTQPGAAASVSPTLPPIEQDVLQVQEVVGIGILQNEVVQIRRTGEGELNLSGWMLKDEDGHVFTFPALTLNTGGSVWVYSRTGSNSVIELFWNLDEAVWSNGETVSLYDPAGNLRAAYSIP